MNENNNNAANLASPILGRVGDMTLVNAHMHSPFSFSAFDSIEQALDMAVSENVRVVGINDFYETDGYEKWSEECLKRNLFPLFNIEFISLNIDDQKNGIRVNDPSNPGRTYLSGKGLSFPFKLDEPYLGQLKKLKIASNRHVELMSEKLNELLVTIKSPFSISFQDVKNELTNGSIRERHLAKALRLKVDEYFSNNPAKIGFYKKLFNCDILKSSTSDFASLENEIRSNLLKAGGAAFVPESTDAFLEMEMVRQIILKAGGIPTYPFLADFGKYQFTDFEKDKVKALELLKQRGFASVEFIPTRNKVKVLEEYATYFWNNGFIVSFGTEHNTPAMEPIEVHVNKNEKLSASMLEINYKGACVIAAHQYLVRKGEKGYIDENGIYDIENRDNFIAVGNKVIQNGIAK